MTDIPINRRHFLKTIVGGAVLSSTTSHSVTAQNIAEGPTVYFGAYTDYGKPTKSIYAVDAATGEEIWSKYNGTTLYPIVVDGSVYAGTSGSRVFSLDAATGEREWVFTKPTGAATSVTVVDERVYTMDFGGTLWAIDTATGEQEWKFTNPTAGGDTPTVVDGTVYIGSSENTGPSKEDRDGTLWAVNSKTGDLEWTFTEPPATVSSSPTVVDNTVYVGSADRPYENDSALWAVNAATGEQKWVFTKPSKTVESSPTVVDGTVYVGSNDNTLWAVDAATGEQEWAFTKPSGSVRSSPTVVDGTVYVGSSEGTLWAVDTATGDLKWTLEVGTDVWNYSIDSSPTVFDGTVYVGSDKGILHALDADTGEKKWNFTHPHSLVSASPTVVKDPSNGDSIGSRVNLGTLGHHHIFAENGPTGPGIPDSSDLEAEFTFDPAEPSINQPITFDASASEAAEGEITEFHWDFTNNGEIDETGVVVEHTFNKQNNYNITLSIVGDSGTEDNTTKTIDVGINGFETRVNGKLGLAQDIDDAAIYLSELDEVNEVIGGIREEFYRGEFDNEVAEEAITRLEVGERVSDELLLRTGEYDSEIEEEEEQIAIDTTTFTIRLGVALAMLKLSLADEAANSRFSNLIPDEQILRAKLDTAIEELVSVGFSKARESEAVAEINGIVQEAYDGILNGEFDDEDDFFDFISDSIGATVANLTIMRSIETGEQFSPHTVSAPYIDTIDPFINAKASLESLNTTFEANAIKSRGLTGTEQGARDASNNARDTIALIASTTDTFLSELEARTDLAEIIKDTFTLTEGIIESDLNALDAFTLISVLLLPKAAFAMAAVSAIGKFIGDYSIRLMMTTQAVGVAGVEQGDPISLDEIDEVIPDVDSALDELNPVDLRWGEDE